MGGGSSGNDFFFAGPGNDQIGLGSGQDVVFAGSGNATVTGGAGKDVLAVARGQAGGVETLLGFKPGTDLVSLQGFAPGEAARALAGASATPATATQPAGTMVTLSDNTRIVFAGLGSLGPGLFG